MKNVFIILVLFSALSSCQPKQTGSENNGDVKKDDTGIQVQSVINFFNYIKKHDKQTALSMLDKNPSEDEQTNKNMIKNELGDVETIEHLTDIDAIPKKISG